MDTPRDKNMFVWLIAHSIPWIINNIGNKRINEIINIPLKYIPLKLSIF
ncbi:hypothetical protein CBOS2020_19350 [Clostridium botulinum]|nr:hypothetical protein CBOS2020_19350 [Clostridium botulinum]